MWYNLDAIRLYQYILDSFRFIDSIDSSDIAPAPGFHVAPAQLTWGNSVGSFSGFGTWKWLKKLWQLRILSQVEQFFQILMWIYIVIPSASMWFHGHSTNLLKIFGMPLMKDTKSNLSILQLIKIEHGAFEDARWHVARCRVLRVADGFLLGVLHSNGTRTLKTQSPQALPRRNEKSQLRVTRPFERAIEAPKGEAATSALWFFLFCFIPNLSQGWRWYFQSVKCLDDIPGVHSWGKSTPPIRTTWCKSAVPERHITQLRQLRPLRQFSLWPLSAHGWPAAPIASGHFTLSRAKCENLFLDRVVGHDMHFLYVKILIPLFFLTWSKCCVYCNSEHQTSLCFLPPVASSIVLKTSSILKN